MILLTTSKKSIELELFLFTGMTMLFKKELQMANVGKLLESLMKDLIIEDIENNNENMFYLVEDSRNIFLDLQIS